VETKRVSTGCDSLDQLLGGGVERGIITNFYGESGTGKTNACVQMAAETAKDGDTVVYIDTEASFSPERFEQIASEQALENVMMRDATSFDDQKQAVRGLEEIASDQEIGLVVVDSIVSLYRLKVDSGNASDVNQELSRQFSKLSKIAREQEIPVLVTNQVYTSFDEDELELVGRDVPKYWSKCLVKLSQKGQDTREAEILKHRSRPQGNSVRFKITDKGLEATNEGML
jgi:DNA repair and recombination protein RadB